MFGYGWTLTKKMGKHIAAWPRMLANANLAPVPVAGTHNELCGGESQRTVWQAAAAIISHRGGVLQLPGMTFVRPLKRERLDTVPWFLHRRAGRWHGWSIVFRYKQLESWSARSSVCQKKPDEQSTPGCGVRIYVANNRNRHSVKKWI